MFWLSTNIGVIISVFLSYDAIALMLSEAINQYIFSLTLSVIDPIQTGFVKALFI